jgi:ubiquinone/menaquinone biosynthesis C-methylase UbiE
MDLPKQDTRNFYDRIADVHNLVLRLNGYRNSVARFLRSIDLGIDENSLVLDAGSGTGIITLAFQSAGLKPKHLVAVDLSRKSLEVARNQFRKDSRCDEGRISVSQSNILALPFGDESFDLVLTCGVLEYVPLGAGIKELSRVIRKGGKLILIPVKPSFVGSVLEILYKFKTIRPEDIIEQSEGDFTVKGRYDFPISEPISWSKSIVVLEKKSVDA